VFTTITSSFVVLQPRLAYIVNLRIKLEAISNVHCESKRDLFTFAYNFGKY